MRNRNFRRNRSGQVIVVTALMVAMVLLSTAIYVIETEKNVPVAASDANSDLSAYQQAARNTLISALANVTGGGNPNVLAVDLGKLESAIDSDSYQSILQMTFAPSSGAPYQNGFYVSWGTGGRGISSVCVTLDINSAASDSVSNFECTIKVTSQLDLAGTSSQLDDNTTQITLTLSLTDDGSPALAQTLSCYVENTNGTWINLTAPTTRDYGNGTYIVSSTEPTDQLIFPLQVSAVCLDQRGITTMANATCTNTG